MVSLSRSCLALAFAVMATSAPSAAAADGPSPATMVRIGGGTYRPLFAATPADREIPVKTFRLDRTPVTNGAFLAFVTAHPEWRKDRIPATFAEPGYLAAWAAPTSLGGNVDPAQPVTSVSWFAARAFCADRGARLPTEAEWEHAAAASRTRYDGDADPAWRAELTALYARPAPARLPAVGRGQPNLWGVHDMHGLVFEWIEDFAGAKAAVSADGSSRFCGATAGGSGATTDFAAFERVALRTSLHGHFTLKNLGFRCAADDAPETQPKRTP